MKREQIEEWWLWRTKLVSDGTSEDTRYGQAQAQAHKPERDEVEKDDRMNTPDDSARDVGRQRW